MYMIQKLWPPAKEARATETSAVWSVRKPLKAIKVELSDKQTVVSLLEILGATVFHKDVRVMNLEGSSVGSERDNTGLSVQLCFAQDAVHLGWKRLRF